MRKIISYVKDRRAWREVPDALQTKMYKWLGLNILLLVLVIFILAIAPIAYMLIGGLLLQAILVGVALYFYDTVTKGRYDTFNGVVMEKQKKGVLHHRYTLVVMKCDDERVISFALREGMTLLAPGLRITLYVAKSANKMKSADGIRYGEYLAFKVGKD